jgi:hypothetical protein
LYIHISAGLAAWGLQICLMEALHIWKFQLLCFSLQQYQSLSTADLLGCMHAKIMNGCALENEPQLVIS